MSAIVSASGFVAVDWIGLRFGNADGIIRPWARLASVVLEGVPPIARHTHRGNRRGCSGRARDPLAGRFMAWADWLAAGLRDAEVEAVREATRTDRPCGDEAFV